MTVDRKGGKGVRRGGEREGEEGRGGNYLHCNAALRGNEMRSRHTTQRVFEFEEHLSHTFAWEP